MYISAVEIQGLADLPYCLLKDIPSQGMTFLKATPETVALADAVEMWFAAFDEESLVDVLVQWGWAVEEDIEVFGDGLVEELSWFDGTCAKMWVEDREVTITVDVQLDGAVVQDLRRLIPNPEVHVALMSDPRFSATLSLRWTADFQAMALSFSSVSLGPWKVPADKPKWYLALMHLFARRFFRNHNRFSVAETALSSMLSVDAFHRYETFQRACEVWGRIRVASILDREPMLLIDERSIRRWGSDIDSQLRVLAAWHLSGAAIVWSDLLMEEPPVDVQVWGIEPNSPSSIDGATLNLRALDTTLTFPNR